MNAPALGLLAFGYAASIPVIVRFVPVVRERRWRWLAVHHVGVVALITGGWLRDAPAGALINASWLVASSAWYLSGRWRPGRASTSGVAVKESFSHSSPAGNSRGHRP